MQLDPKNNAVKLCAEGMNLEGAGKGEEALKLFQQAWIEAKDDVERFISAHYIARHQESIADKLKWDEIALNLALKVEDENIKGAIPSLYLNVAKCHEDLNAFDEARKNYAHAYSFINFLGDDGYCKMIKAGILNGIERVTLHGNKEAN